MSGVPEEGTASGGATTEDESESTAEEADVRAHLADVEDGCGCAEVWEHLSSGRSE